MGKRNVAILLYDDVEVLDFAGPFEVFSVTAELADGSFDVFTVAESERIVRAIGGLRVLPDCTLASRPKVDVLVVPGGAGSRREMDNRVIVRWVKRASEEAELRRHRTDRHDRGDLRRHRWRIARRDADTGRVRRTTDRVVHGVRLAAVRAAAGDESCPQTARRPSRPVGRLVP